MLVQSTRCHPFLPDFEGTAPGSFRCRGGRQTAMRYRASERDHSLGLLCFPKTPRSKEQLSPAGEYAPILMKPPAPQQDQQAVCPHTPGASGFTSWHREHAHSQCG